MTCCTGQQTGCGGAEGVKARPEKPQSAGTRHAQTVKRRNRAHEPSKQLLGLVGEVVEDERLLYQQGNRIEKERAPSTHPREKAQERED